MFSNQPSAAKRLLATNNWKKTNNRSQINI